MPIWVQPLKASGQIAQLHFTVCIVGSRKILQDDDYGSGNWSLLAPNLTIYGFDADADACAAANADLENRGINWIEKHFPLALARQAGTSTLYVTESPSCSSLYPPNEPYISRFVGFQESMQPDFTVEIETTTIDQFFCNQAAQDIDFLQVDVQGADLDVLQGGAGLLENSVLGVQVEVEFAPLYVNQPLFTDVDLYLRQFGFTLFDLITENPWCRVTRACSPLYAATRKGQLTWADACYLLDPIYSSSSNKAKNPNQILKLACLADILNFPDYTLELLQYLTIHYGDNSAFNFAPVIVETLSQFPQLVEQGLDSLPVIASIRDRLT